MDVLAYSPSYQSWSDGVFYAADLAARLDGSLTGAFVYASPLYMLPPCGSADLLEAILESTRDIERTAHASADAFVTWAHTVGVRQARWQVAEGQMPQTLAHLGNWHDLLVVERNADLPWGAPLGVGRIVLGGHLPCVVAPAGVREARLDRIAIAWNGSEEAIRCVRAALPLLHHAQQVFLFDGRRGEVDLEVGWQPSFDIDDYLRRHSVTAQHIAVDADEEGIGTALADAANGVAANLLVMGAYGRSRLSEWAFGGATRFMLHDAPCPVLFHT